MSPYQDEEIAKWQQITNWDRDDSPEPLRPPPNDLILADERQIDDLDEDLDEEDEDKDELERRQRKRKARRRHRSGARQRNDVE